MGLKKLCGNGIIVLSCYGKGMFAMKLTNSAQMREMDKYVIENLNISGTYLMERAAKHLAATSLELLTLSGSVAVFCGTGNNGGDGICAAAHLIDKGVPVRVFLVGDPEKLTNDSLKMSELLRQVGGVLEPFSSTEEIEEYTISCEVIIDALFGIGLHSPIIGDTLEAVRMINHARACVISADISSGVHADTGAILGEAVWADITVTFSMAKAGHFLEPGCMYCGELRVYDIGLPRDIIESVHSPVFAITTDDINLPRRRPDTHKGNFGRCTIAAGSVGYTGAPALAARAASKIGAGLVFLGVPEKIYDIMACKLDEEMPFPLPCDSIGKLSANAASEILRQAQSSDVLLLGPGLGTSSDISELVMSIIRLIKKPIVLDADGINAIASNVDILKQSAGPLILTPHRGEYLRLGGDLTSGNRLNSAREFAHRYGCILVLKGHRTITAMPDGTAYINTTGGPAMAKGGSGDVLAGMIAGLIAQNFPLKEAVTTAVYLHGLAGDMCASEMGEYSVTAGDIISMIPKAVMSAIRN